MKRRTLIAASIPASLAVLPAGRARAAESTIGWVSIDTREGTAPFFKAFQVGLLAHRGGDRVRIVERYVTTGADDMARAVGEIQQLGARLIVTQGPATPPVVRLGPAVPIVFGFSADPILAGMARSLARPGGNATGVTFMTVELNPKRIDLLRIALPACRTIGLLSFTPHFGEENEIAACQQALERSGVQLRVYRAKASGEFLPAVGRALDEGVQALVLLPSTSMVRQTPAISAQCMGRKVPVVGGWASMAHAGALLTYGPNLAEAYKLVAAQAMRVLGGAPAGMLPIQQPTVLELVVNTKVAQTLGITLPPTLLAQADEIIE
jgi:putative ABC transport system substrate-binding protein